MTSSLDQGLEETLTCGVDERMRDLERWFNTLLTQFKTELSDRGVTVDDHNLLPGSEYDLAIQERLTDIKAESVMIHGLRPLFNFINYSLPYNLISEFGSTELKGKMKLYILNVQAFMRETTLSDVMDIWAGNEGSGTANFSRLRIMFDKDPNKCTLEKLESIRKHICSDLKVSEHMIKLVSLVTTNSFIATWLIPTQAIPEIVEAASHVDKSFYENEQILKVLLDETVLVTHSLYLPGKLNKRSLKEASFTPRYTKPCNRNLSLQLIVAIQLPLMIIIFAAMKNGCSPTVHLISQPPNINILRQSPVSLFDKLIGVEDSFGKALLNDTYGSILMTIEESSNKTSDKIIQICTLWIEGKGRLPVTWSTLISVLNEIQFESLAVEIHDLIQESLMHVNASEPGFNWLPIDISQLWHKIEFRKIIWKPPDSVVISKPPDISLLQQPPITTIVDEFSRLDDHHEVLLFLFGKYLLGDKTSKLMKTMKSDMKSVHDIGIEICKQWIEGKGSKPVTWNTLIDALLSAQRNELAQNVTKSINETVLNIQGHYTTFYDVICKLKEIYKDIPLNEHSFGNLTDKFFDITLVQYYRDDLWYQLNEIENQKRITLSLWSLLDELDSSISRQLLITGLFGAGKTTLMRYISKMWAEGRVLHHCEILFLMNFENEHQDGRDNLDIQQLISTSFPQLTAYAGLVNLTKEIEAKHGAGVCLLLDGYHRLEVSKFGLTSVNYFMFDDSLHSLRWIATSHPEKYYPWSSKLLERNYDVKYVQLTGISNNTLELYLNQLTSEIKVRKGVLELWNLYPEVREICTLPRYLNMTIFIAMFNNIENMTRTELYTAFMNLTTQYYCDEHQGMSCDSNSLYLCIHSSSDKESDMCNALKATHTAAFDSITSNYTYHKNMSSIMQRNVNRLGFVTVSDYTHRALLFKRVEFTFCHSYFTHYFAALHLTTLSQNEQFLYLYSLSQHSSFVSVTFFFGLMSKLYPNHQNSILLKRFYVYKSHQLPSGFCRFEIDTHFFEVIQDTQWPEKQLSDILKSEQIIVNNSLCITGHSSSTENAIIRNLLKHNISTFQLGTDRNISFLFENHTDTVDGEYIKLIPSLYNENIEQNHFPSITTIVGDCKSISNFSTMINRQRFPALHSLQVIDLIVTKSDGRIVLDVINKLVHFKMLKFSMKCRLFPVIFDKPEVFSSVSYLHLELWHCMSNDLDVHIMSWITGIQSMCPIGPVQSVLNYKPFNQLKALTLVAPHESVNIPYILHEITHNLQQFRLRRVNINEANINETLSQLQNLQILEISQTNLGNTELEGLFKHLPLSLQELSLSNCHLKNHQVISLSKALKSLPNLNSLNLSDNAVTGEGLTKLVSALKYHKNFHSLDLSYQSSYNVCGIEIEELSQLTNLHYLNIQGCRVPRTMKNSLFNAYGQLTKLRSLHLCLVTSSSSLDKLSLILTKYSKIEPHCDLYKHLSDDPINSLEILNSTGDLLSLLKKLSLSGDPLRLLKVLINDPKDLLSEVNITNIPQSMLTMSSSSIDHDSKRRLAYRKIYSLIVNWMIEFDTSTVADLLHGCTWRHPDLMDFHTSLTNLPQLQSLKIKCRLPMY